MRLSEELPVIVGVPGKLAVKVRVSERLPDLVDVLLAEPLIDLLRLSLELMLWLSLSLRLSLLLKVVLGLGLIVLE